MSFGSDASFPQPANDANLETSSKKRKRDERAETDWDRRPFTIQPDTSDPFAVPRTFVPLLSLSRAQLPLSYLDTHHIRHFAAYISALEWLEEVADHNNILIVRDERDNRLYAIEPAGMRTYVLCRLAAWVTLVAIEHAIQTSTSKEIHLRRRRVPTESKFEKPWWSVAVSAAASKSDSIPAERVRKPRLSILAVTDAEQPVERSRPDAEIEDQSKHVVTENTFPPQCPSNEDHSTDGMLQELAKNYLEALYVSRVSLAYFVKGPLSRIRTAFTNQANGDSKMSDLLDFLRQAILTVSVMDKKYREVINDTVRESVANSLVTSEQSAKRKRKRKWKPKRDKRGLFTEESSYIERWWRESDDGCESVHTSGETVEDGLKRRMPALRKRETYLQLILVLEVLALEDLLYTRQLSNEDRPHASCTHRPDLDIRLGGESATSIRKLKQPHELTVLLDTMLDRLCIWQSVESRSPLRKDAISDADPNATSDELRDFCVEVVIPFYASRIPTQASTVSQKLGGPSAPKPAKRNAASSHKPGEPTVRQYPESDVGGPAKEPRTERRADLCRPSSLQRSATDSEVVSKTVKRESSEAPISLDGIPVAKAPQPRKRTSLMHSLSFSRREIDLCGTSQAHDTKTRKKAEVEEKLRAAITALKKPNRALATQELAESADSSFAKATAKRRPGSKAKAVADAAIHVTATPKQSRSSKLLYPAGSSVAKVSDHAAQPDSAVVPSSAGALAQISSSMMPPSSNVTVPQTGRRPRHSAPVAMLDQTPSRRLIKHPSPHPPDDELVFASPCVVRSAPTAIGETPSKNARKIVNDPRSASQTENMTNAIDASAGRRQEKMGVRALEAPSIYDTLGWDEEYEVLE